MRTLLLVTLLVCAVVRESAAQNMALNRYGGNFGKKLDKQDQVLFIPVQYGCDDCNNKVLAFFKKNQADPQTLFVFVAKGSKLMRLYLNKHLKLTPDALKSKSNIILDDAGLALTNGLLDVFPKLYLKKEAYLKGIALDNTNFSQYLH